MNNQQNTFIHKPHTKYINSQSTNKIHKFINNKQNTFIHKQQAKYIYS